ncbi:MAG: sigma-70 family RNA polymerase sigma factor [Pyrinomonadaceae bacterium]
MNTSTQITAMLVRWSNGDLEAMDEVYPQIETELKKLARHFIRSIRPGDTMQTTAVINEAYLRLVDQKRVTWQNRAHFFGIAAFMMRRILVNYVRDKRRIKRGGGAPHISLSEAMLISHEKSHEILALEESLKILETIDKRKCRVVEMRYFGGLSAEETAEVLGISEVTVNRDWRFAKGWLAREIRNEV